MYCLFLLWTVGEAVRAVTFSPVRSINRSTRGWLVERRQTGRKGRETDTHTHRERERDGLGTATQTELRDCRDESSMPSDAFNDLRISSLSARERIFKRASQGILTPPSTPVNSFVGGLRTGKAPVLAPAELASRQRPSSARQTRLMTLRMPAQRWLEPPLSPRDLLWTTTVRPLEAHGLRRPSL